MQGWRQPNAEPPSPDLSHGAPRLGEENRHGLSGSMSDITDGCTGWKGDLGRGTVTGMSKARRTAAEVARYLREFIDGVGGEWDWDDFESVPIADAVLDDIRQRAADAAPPNPDMQRLRQLLAEAEALAAGSDKVA